MHPLAELWLQQWEGPDFTGQDFQDVMRLEHRSRSWTMRHRSGQRSTSTTTAPTRSGGAAMVTVCCRPGTR